MTFAQGRNRLTKHLSERIPVVKLLAPELLFFFILAHPVYKM